jgi:hypothetical protein
LRNAQQSYEEADSRLSRTRNSLEQLAQGAVTEPELKALSPVADEKLF